MKPNFTIALIGRNEGLTIPRLVASLGEFKNRGGEILLLDTGSTDNTVEVAKSLGCVVVSVGDQFQIRIDKDKAEEINKKFVVENETPVILMGNTLFDFASSRNFIANIAKTDWIWMPDCDESFTHFDLEEIEKAISNKNVDRLEYEYIFSHDAYGNPAIRFMHSKMYRKSNLEWKGIVHEVLTLKDGKIPLPATYLPEDQVLLEHFQNNETNRSGYLKGLALDCYLNPESDRNSHYFAREMLFNGRPLSAIKEFERHLAMNKWVTEASQSMIFIGDAYRRMEKDPTSYYERAFEMEPNRREPLIRLAEYYSSKDDHQKVVEYAEKSLSILRGNFYADYQEHYTYRPHDLLYKAYWYLNNKEKSKENYDISASYKPHDPWILKDRRFYYQLPKITIILPTLDREIGVTRCLNSIKTLNYPQELIETFVIKGEKTVPEKVKEGLELASGEYIVYAADDCEFTPNSLIIAILEDKDLVSFNTGKLYDDYGNICEHFIIKKEFISKIGGEIFDTEFHHIGVDNLLWAKANKYGTVKYCEEAIVHHYHFTRGGQMDKTYEKGWDKQFLEKDRELLKNKLIELTA